jgi:hypothetical protein
MVFANSFRLTPTQVPTTSRISAISGGPKIRPLNRVVSLNAARSIAGRVKQLFIAQTTVLNGAEKLIELIRNQIDIVLHGHEHLPVCFREPTVNAIIVSAGTTSEWNGIPYANSFYVITFYDDRTVDIEERVWTGSGLLQSLP